MHFWALAHCAMEFGNCQERTMFVIIVLSMSNISVNSFISYLIQMVEFRSKMGSILPRLTKDTPQTSQTDFDGLTDLMKYLSTWGKE